METRAQNALYVSCNAMCLIEPELKLKNNRIHEKTYCTNFFSLLRCFLFGFVTFVLIKKANKLNTLMYCIYSTI